MDEKLQRLSQGKIVNMNCRKLLECCKMHDLRICNGRLDSDLGIGKYAYVGSSDKTVVDYILVNPFLLNFFSTFEVCEPNILSDHCAIQFSLKVKSYIWKPRKEIHIPLQTSIKGMHWMTKRRVSTNINCCWTMRSSLNLTHICNKSRRRST